MKRYALTVKLPEIIQKGSDDITNEIVEKFGIPRIKCYPAHIPIKYGFNFADENKLITFVKNFNKSLSPLTIQINGLRGAGKLFHLKVEKNPQLKKIQKKLQDSLRSELDIQDIREEETSEDYEFHFSLAESSLDEKKILEIQDILKTKNLSFTFNSSRIGIMVKRGDAFVDLPLEEKQTTFYERLSNPEKPFIIAEIGSNHNGRIDLAKRLIDAAVQAGADAVKFQSWEYNSLFAQSVLDSHTDFKAEDVVGQGLEEVQKTLALSKEQHFELQEYCNQKGIIFSTSVFDPDYVDFLANEVNIPFFKIASLDIINHPLLRKIAQTKKPIVLSTGMATMAEIDNALRVIKSEGNNKIVLLHCIAAYPTAPHQVNLKNIEMLTKAYNLPVGYSDHSISIAVPATALAFGASVIEKHIKLEDLHCRDGPVSLVPLEFKSMVSEIRFVAQAIGTSQRVLTQDEMDRRVAVFGRRSILTANRKFELGHVLTIDDLCFKRPGTGLSPEYVDFVIGRKLKNEKGPEEVISLDDLE
jgi:N,N'-diacetyllegionaminate synthase